MSKRELYANSIFFALLIIISNYTVQYPINDWLTYGAVVYPFTFLITDILSEKYSKKEVLKVVKIGSILAAVPTVFVADIRIALASIITFIVVQQVDVQIFHKLKEKYENLWWLRNNGSTMTSQFLDTIMFFLLAFSFVMPFDMIVKLIIGDYAVKFIIALLDTPVFYLAAIRFKPKR